MRLEHLIAWVVSAVMLSGYPSVAGGGETLYNGIRLPDTWPPKIKALDRETRHLEPMPVPYLDDPPAVVPIDVGRQLFVDDFLIEETTLKRSFHSARYHPVNPVLAPEGDWNYGNVQSSSTGCLVVGDKLYFYVSARAKDPTGMHAKASTGLAVLRRDGFASMDAHGKGGTVTTRPLTFKGKYLFVNVDCPKGELKVEVLDTHGKVVAPFTAANCQPIACDKTLAAVAWKGASDLSAASGKPVKFRFHLNNGKLYAFWVSPQRSGASFGYVAAGGPGFTGPTDTVGMNPAQRK